MTAKNLKSYKQLISESCVSGDQVAELSEFIEGRLYFMVMSVNKNSSTLMSFKDWRKSINDNSVFYLNVDRYLVYKSFSSDFGPLNLAMIYLYIDTIRDLFKTYKRVVHWSHELDQKGRSNAAFLICAYMIIEENWTAHQTYSILSNHHEYCYMPFRDASCLMSSEYSVTVEECVNAFYKAKWYGFFDFSDFDLDEYEKYQSAKFGDINWIVPGTLLAFPSPYSRNYIDKTGYHVHSPAYYYKYFKDNNVKHVVRLNSEVTYNAKRTFVAVANIQHTDMIFTDGTPPSDLILKNFLRLCEQYIDDCPKVESTNNKITKPNKNSSNKRVSGTVNATKNVGAVAVHCKAGLGRTGCLVASYIVKHWSFTAVEAIAWIRICRPGSVISDQQKWLIKKEKYLKTDGKQWRKKRNHSIDKYRRFKYGVNSIKQHTYKTNAYEYVDPPPYLNISYDEKFSGTKCVKSQISDGFVLTRLASNKVSKKKKTNNHVIPNAQTGVQIPDSGQKRSKNEDSKIKSTLSTIKSSRRATNTSVGLNKSNLIKKKNVSPSSIKITRNNSKSSLSGKKKTKALNKTTRLTRATASETETKKEEFLKTDGKQWGEKRNHSIDKRRRFKNGVYSIKRHTSKTNAYEDVDPSPQSSISYDEKFSSTKSGNSQISDEFVLTRSASNRLSKKRKINNQIIPDAQSGVQVADSRQMQSKNEDSKIKRSRQATNTSVELNMSNRIKKKNVFPTSMTMTRNNSKSSLIGKNNSKALNMTTRLTRSTASLTETKISNESKPSHTLATVASSVRASRRLRNQNIII